MALFNAKPRLDSIFMSEDEFGLYADSVAGIEGSAAQKQRSMSMWNYLPSVQSMQKLARVTKPGFVAPKQVLPHFMKLVLAAQVRRSKDVICCRAAQGQGQDQDQLNRVTSAISQYEDQRLSEMNFRGEREDEDDAEGGDDDDDMYETVSESATSESESGSISRSRAGWSSSSSSLDIGVHVDYGNEEDMRARVKRQLRRRRKNQEEGVDEMGNFVGSVKKLSTVIGAKYYREKGIKRRDAVVDTGEVMTSPVRRRLSRVAWRHEMDNTEPAYRLPALILKQHQWVRKEEPRRLGPGTYDDNYDEIQKAKKNGTTKGVLNTCLPRFEKEKDLWEAPGPGTYGSGYEKWEKYVDKAKHPGRVTLFQSGPCDVRGDAGVQGGSGLASTHYKAKDGLDATLNKVVSLRGPYDLYSSEILTIPYGYYKTLKPNPLGPGQYNIQKTFKQEWRTGGKQFKGFFSPCPRFRKLTGERITYVAPLWPIDTDKFPGPADYNPYGNSDKKIKPSKYAFSMSAELRPDEKTDYDMAPNRYRIERKNYCPVGCGHKSTFLSKTQRLDPLKAAILTERLRAKDIPPPTRKLEDPCCKSQRSPYLDQYQWKTSCETACDKLQC